MGKGMIIVQIRFKYEHCQQITQAEVIDLRWGGGGGGGEGEGASIKSISLYAKVTVSLYAKVM